MKASYADLGRYIARKRREALIDRQNELARLLGISQQTVSRWEAGLSRPRAIEIPRLAAALKTDLNQLLEVAGYAPERAIVSLDEPFPLNSMRPESFERLAADLIQAMHPKANVNRAGGPGHTQHGVDVVAVFPDGQRCAFQCKRVSEFGPRKVRQVVSKDTTVSDRKFLLLSRTASPEARAVLEEYPHWELWDGDDISRKLRELPKDDLKRIVRIYFPGQQLALLGASPESPWETVDEFFSAFGRKDILFSHVWELVGQGSLVQRVLANLNDSKVHLILLTGAGGSGKSRILKEVLHRFSSARRETTIRIASPTMNITKASLEDLRGGHQLLVVDDAHDRDDLEILFNYAAAHPGKVSLLFASRPYGADHIKAQAGSYSLSGAHIAAFDVSPLSSADAEALAQEVLEDRGGPIEAAKDIAELTKDCALATVVGAQIVATDNIHPLLAQGRERFRATLFVRFEDVIAGRIDERDDSGRIRKALAFLALVQPVSIEDTNLLRALEAVEGIGIPDAQRILKLLIEAGVLFRRGSRYRLSPDVLGDFLLEKHFEGPDGRSNGLAERYFDLVPEAYVGNLILNMGRIDWRRNGQAAEGPLLDGVWAKLRPKYEYVDPHVQAVTAVAYYQPKRALAFVEKLIPEKRFNSQLAQIAKYAAFSGPYLRRALECLWELGRGDKRETNPHPTHPIRLLTELAAPQVNKPLSVNEDVLNFCVDIATRVDSWSGRFTPFDVLDGLLATEGFTNTYARHAVSFSPFFVSPKAVAKLRARAIDFVVSALRDPNTRKAVRAAKSVGAAIRGPLGLFGSKVNGGVLEEWDAEFAVTLNKIESVISNGPLDPLVEAEIGRVIAWHETRGQPESRKAAARVRQALSSSLDVWLDRALTDGYGMEDGRPNSVGRKSRWAKSISEIAHDVTSAYPDNTALIAVLEERLGRAEEAYPSQNLTPEVLVRRLIDDVRGFAGALLDGVLAGYWPRMRRFAGYALGRLFYESPQFGRQQVAAFLASHEQEFWAAVGNAYAMQRFDSAWVTPTDVNHMRQLLASSHEWVLLVALRAVRSLSEWNPDIAVDLCRATNIPTARVADEVAALFEFGDRLKVATLPSEDIDSLLARFESLPQLEGHWLQKLLVELSEYRPWQLAKFFMRRVEAASDNPGAQIRPCNYGPWAQEPLRFRRSAKGLAVMRELIIWMRANAQRRGLFSHYSRTLFGAMFAPFDAELVSFFSDWLTTAAEDDIGMIASLLREAHPDFVFDASSFVIRLLERAQLISLDLCRNVTGELYASAISGMRHGTPGEPFPEDVSLKRKAEQEMTKLSRFSPAFDLYDSLREHAERSIKRSLQEAEDSEE